MGSDEGASLYRKTGPNETGVSGAESTGAVYPAVLSGMLDSHLADVDQQAEVRFDTVLGQYKRLHEIDEHLKAEDQMRWIQAMDLARSEAEQNVLERNHLRLSIRDGSGAAAR